MKKRGEPLNVKEKTMYLAAGAALLFWAHVSGLALAGAFLILLFAATLKLLSAKYYDRHYNIAALAFLTFLGIAVIVLARAAADFSPYWLPVSGIAMLVVLLYRDLEVSLMLSVLLSFFSGLKYGGDLLLTANLLSGSVLASLCVWQARRRSKIITAGVFVGILQALGALAVGGGDFRALIAPFFGGVFSSFLVAGLLPVFEALFRVATNISLLEVADFNHPLLKRLVLEAPGTYHHSLMVGNLAEMAAESVGANALLARVGAYYHDIGKLEKPEYFSENQDRFSNKHDQLNASMSKLVIMDHVKTGVELAEKNRLNSAIVDFITQHHGTSLVYYFYRRALEAGVPQEGGVSEEVFRYPGPRPQSKETAIVLLADSVEAACRTLDEPTAERISDIVHRVINNKFIDGQLDACDLTLRDLEKIATVFIHILGGFYHTRVDYPNPSKNKSAENSPEA